MHSSTFDLIQVEEYIKFLERTGKRKGKFEGLGIFFLILICILCGTTFCLFIISAL